MRTLHLERRLESVDGSEDHSEGGSAWYRPDQLANLLGGDNLRPYHNDAKMVLTGGGRFFKYEFDWSRARIPAFAAVSPNLETGPI